jgi:site-specific recombinase XerD
VVEFWKRVASSRKKPKIEMMIDGVSGFLFLDGRGKPMLAYQWEKKFQRSVEKYNKIYKVELPKITPHICRHTYCTNMAKSGTSVKTLQDTQT